MLPVLEQQLLEVYNWGLPRRVCSHIDKNSLLSITLAHVLSSFREIGFEHRRIARGLLLVAVFSLVGKLVGAFKEIAIAYRFGMSEIVDVYVLAFTFAIWIPATASSVINGIYIPLVHRLEKSEKDTFIRQFAGLGFIVAGAITLFLLSTLPWLLDAMTGQFSADIQLSLNALALGFAPLAGMAFLAAMFSAMLLAEEKHANTLFEVFPSLALVALVLIWPIGNSIDPLLWGSLLGAALQAGGLYLLLVRSGMFKIPEFSFRSSGWARVKQDIGIVLFGQFIMSFVEPISSVIAADLGPGNVAGLGYSNRLLALFLTLGATTVSRAILPVLSKTQKDPVNQIKLGIQWSALMFFAGIILATIAWIFTPQLVHLMLERGAFTANDTAKVSEAIRFGVLQFPFFFSGIVLAQLFFSLRLYRIILASAVLAISVKVLCSLLLAPVYNFAGIIMASVPMYAATNLLFITALWRSNRLKKRLVP